MRQDDFVNFMRATICKFEQGNSYGTAHIYKNSLSNLIAFYRTERIRVLLKAETAQLECCFYLLAHNPGNL